MTSRQKVDLTMKDLRSVVDNDLVPENVRKAASDSISALQDSALGMAIKVRKAVCTLDEITSDYNVSPFVKMKFQTVKSKLEDVMRVG